MARKAYALDSITMPKGGFHIFCNSKSVFDSTYPAICDTELGEGGPADSNGDDQIAVTYMSHI